MAGKRRARGIIIALSGMESSGKSTQMRLVEEHLASKSYSPTYLWIRPGYTPNIQAAKRWLRRLRGKRPGAAGNEAELTTGDYPKRAASFRSPLRRWLWLSVGLLDLIWTCCAGLRYSRARGRAVLVDRYMLDALVDYRVNFPDQRVERRILFRLLRRFAVRPDAWFYLMIPAQESIERSEARGRGHQEALSLLEQKESLYRELAEQFGARVVDARLPIDELFGEMRAELDGVATDSSSGQ